MPIKPEPYDLEVIAHPQSTPALGEHPINGDEACQERTELEHVDRDGDRLTWRCTRKRGHMGRHEAAYVPNSGETPELWLSWAQRPKD